MSESELDALVESVRSTANVDEREEGFAYGLLRKSADAITTLRAELKKEREDAERYRWLRTGDTTIETSDGPEFVAYIPELGHDGSNLDAAIDSARSAS